MRCVSMCHTVLPAHAHWQWSAEGLSSTGAPGQPVPHRPLTRHGAAPPNVIQSALPLPSCRLFQQVAGLLSLASSGLVRLFLAAAAATSYAAGLNILSTSTRSTTADAFEHAGKHARAYAREPCELGSIPRRVEPDKLLSLLFDDSLRGMRCAALCTLLRCLAHARSHVVTSLCFCMAGCGCGFELGY